MPIEQLLNIPGIRVLSVKYDEHRIECQIESTQGYSRCHTCGQKATEFHEYGQELELRHLPLCGRRVILRLRPKRYRCLYCEGAVTTTERAEWYDAKAGCTKAYAEFLLLARVNGTLQEVAKKHGVAYDGVRGVLKRCVKGEVDWRQLKVLRILMDIITNYFISRSSSGWVEGLNNKIKVLKRRSYGIKNLANLFRRIWLDLRGYEAFAH